MPGIDGEPEEDPLGLGDLSGLEATPTPTPGTAGPTMGDGQIPTAAMPVPTQPTRTTHRWGQGAPQSFAMDENPTSWRPGVFDIIAAILAIVHGVVGWGHFIWHVTQWLSLGISLRYLLSVSMVAWAAMMVASTVITVAGILILCRQRWSIWLGGYASFAYFGLFALSVVIGMIEWIRAEAQLAEMREVMREAGMEMDADGLMARFWISYLLWNVPRWIAQWVGPVMLIVLFFRTRAR